MPPKATKRGGRPKGATKYTEEELIQLAQIMYRRKAWSAKQWEMVAEEHNRLNAEDGRSNERPATSLRAQWNKLLKSTKPTGDPDCPESVKGAKRTHQMMLAEREVVAMGLEDDSEGEEEEDDSVLDSLPDAGAVIDSQVDPGFEVSGVSAKRLGKEPMQMDRKEEASSSGAVPEPSSGAEPDDGQVTARDDGGGEASGDVTHGQGSKRKRAVLNAAALDQETVVDVALGAGNRGAAFRPLRSPPHGGAGGSNAGTKDFPWSTPHEIDQHVQRRRRSASSSDHYVGVMEMKAELQMQMLRMQMQEAENQRRADAEAAERRREVEMQERRAEREASDRRMMMMMAMLMKGKMPAEFGGE